jgi:hypothetical protein
MTMKVNQLLAKALLAIALALPSVASAATLSLVQNPGDDGAVLTGDTLTGFTFDIEATVNGFDLGDPTFILNGALSAADYAPGGDNFFSGTFSIAGGLLEGTFSDLQLTTYSDIIEFEASLSYTSGILMDGLAGGSLSGVDSSSDFGADLGPVTVIPVPAAVWLFGSGLIGLAGIARRKVA